MCTVQNLKEFIKERLNAVCEEIFSEVQKTIGHYEKEISHQRRLLEISRKPDTNSHIIALPQPHNHEKEHSLDEQQVCNQERNSSLDQVDSEPPQIKEEQEELCSSQEGEQLGLKQEAEGIWTDEEQHRLLETIWKPEIKLYIIDLQEELCSNQEGEQLGLKQESDHSQSEPNSEQLLSHSSSVAERKGEEESQHADSGSTRNAELKKKRYQRNRSHSQNVDNTTLSERQSQTDTMKKSVQCDICGKTFQQKSHLTRHLRSHTGEKPYSCSTCGKTFTDMSASIRHMKSHTNKKQFPCSTCGKVFSHKADLERHIRTHTGEKPYVCSTCGKRFSDVSAFVRHVRIHTGEKPYSCGTCGKRFNQTGNLKTHRKIHAH